MVVWNSSNVFVIKVFRLRGWLKGEMLFFLGSEVKRKIIGDFDREVRIKDPLSSGRQHIIDLKIVGKSLDPHEIAYVELKHWLVGYQRNTRWYAHTYLSDNSSVGISLDAKRLKHISKVPNYIFILATANPGIDDWLKGIDIFNSKYAPFKIPLTVEELFSSENK